MKKSEFIVKIQEKTGYTKGECENIFIFFTEIIAEELQKGGEISFPGVGKLKVKPTKSRKARNPRTGEEIEVPAGKKVIFVASKELKENL